MRLILFTGKGGVGKTTTSAATALLSAESGHRTIVVSTDAAHSLSDSFGVPLDSKPVKINKNLFAQEIDTQKEMEENWGMVQSQVATLIESRGLDTVMAEELAIIPGLEELFSLMEIKEHWDSGSYDVIIVDTAPTGSSLRIMNFPEMLHWYVRNIFNLPAEKGRKKQAAEDTSLLGLMQFMYERIDGLRNILTTSKQASVRLVMNPEKMVVKEAQRGYTYFNLFGLSVDAVVVNKILPQEIHDAFFDGWSAIQSRHVKFIHEAFEPLPILKTKLFEEEIVGEKLLYEFARSLYGNLDPVDVLYREKTMEFGKHNGGVVLKVKLPFAEREKLDLMIRGDELLLSMGPYKHNIALPQSLYGQEPEGAKFFEDSLHIYFGGEKSGRKTKK